MSYFKLLLFALVTGLSGAVGGFFYGLDQGVLAESARRDGNAVQDLTALIDAHAGLIDQANAASRGLRQATAARQAQDQMTTKEFKDALSRSAASRAGCVFDDGVMRQLVQARDRAAAAAAGGIRATMPAASALAPDEGR